MTTADRTGPAISTQQIVDGCCASHARLLDAIAGLTDAHVRRPSVLPGWTVGHVLTHIARNGDSVERRLDGAAAGVIVDQYPGGHDGRTNEIEAGAGRPALELIADVAATSAAVEAAYASMPPGTWENPTRALDGEVQPARAVAFSRWREVEVHHVDLGLGYSPTEWPPDLVKEWLPGVLDTLPGRTEPALLLAWALGRAPAPDLAPW